MKNKLFTRIGTFLMAIMMVMGVSVTAFAAEVPEAQANEVTIAVPANEELSVAADTAVTGSAGAWSSTTLWPHLSSYIGFSKTIRVTTQSSGTNGAVDLELKKNGSLKSDGNWIMGVNDTGEWTLTLPSSGDYELIVHNNSGATIYITAQWL